MWLCAEVLKRAMIFGSLKNTCRFQKRWLLFESPQSIYITDICTFIIKVDSTAVSMAFSFHMIALFLYVRWLDNAAIRNGRAA